ncbi:hypothetical protein NOGI109294_13520 [Nocardiopsis gilva]
MRGHLRAARRSLECRSLNGRVTLGGLGGGLLEPLRLLRWRQRCRGRRLLGDRISGRFGESLDRCLGGGVQGCRVRRGRLFRGGLLQRGELLGLGDVVERGLVRRLYRLVRVRGRSHGRASGGVALPHAGGMRRRRGHLVPPLVPRRGGRCPRGRVRLGHDGGRGRVPRFLRGGGLRRLRWLGRGMVRPRRGGVTRLRPHRRRPGYLVVAHGRHGRRVDLCVRLGLRFLDGRGRRHLGMRGLGRLLPLAPVRLRRGFRRRVGGRLGCLRTHRRCVLLPVLALVLLAAVVLEVTVAGSLWTARPLWARWRLRPAPRSG